MADLQKLWVEKYRPQTVEDYIWQDDTQKRAILRMIGEGSIPHLLLSGVQGSGKTTLSKILGTRLKVLFLLGLWVISKSFSSKRLIT